MRIPFAGRLLLLLVGIVAGALIAAFVSCNRAKAQDHVIPFETVVITQIDSYHSAIKNYESHLNHSQLVPLSRPIYVHATVETVNNAGETIYIEYFNDLAERTYAGCIIPEHTFISFTDSISKYQLLYDKYSNSKYLIYEASCCITRPRSNLTATN